MRILIASPIRNIGPWALKFLSTIIALNSNPHLDIKYLFIEGNSTDGTYKILSKWADNYKQVTLIKHDLPKEMVTKDRVMESIELIIDLAGDTDYIMLVDADILEVPDNMPLTLIENMAKYKADIIAPYVLIEGTNKFYDTYVFRTTDKKLFRSEPPYTPNNYNTPFEVSSVGTCMLFKAGVFMKVITENREYRKMRHKQSYYGYLCVCATARRLGYRIFADPTVIITHADLPKYGYGWHTIEFWNKR
jgi:glycosyltransferase involved in cell wall biosynthesis